MRNQNVNKNQISGRKVAFEETWSIVKLRPDNWSIKKAFELVHWVDLKTCQSILVFHLSRSVFVLCMFVPCLTNPVSLLHLLHVPSPELVSSGKVRAGRASVREEEDDEHLLEGPSSSESYKSGLLSCRKAIHSLLQEQMPKFKTARNAQKKCLLAAPCQKSLCHQIPSHSKQKTSPTMACPVWKNGSVKTVSETWRLKTGIRSCWIMAAISEEQAE